MTGTTRGAVLVATSHWPLATTRWVVGLDEAGYGPNLGPLVQAAVAVRLPVDDPAGWETHSGCLRRAGGSRKDPRLRVDDSKKLHQGLNGFQKLEHGLMAVGGAYGTVEDFLAPLALPGVLDDLRGEAWFDPHEFLPFFPPAPSSHEPVGRIVGVQLLPTPLFNRVVAGSNSKGTALSVGLSALLTAAHAALPAGEPVTVLCDKQGGRTFYAPALQAAFPDGWVVAELETPDESRYRIERLDRELVVVVKPRADADGVSVALASMTAKYLREVCMRQFNRFWAGHVPGLAPTAGYPVDAKRFYAQIRPAMERLGLTEDAVWRSR